MGFVKRENDYEPSFTPPKLSIFSHPIVSKAQDHHHHQPSGMLTPPIHTSASIPFQWEEAPGKPRPCTTQSISSTTVARCLELPPRLLSEAKITNMPSPTTVLDGPYMGRSMSQKLSFGKLGGSFRVLPESKRESKERVVFGSGRWGSSSFVKKNYKDRQGGGGVVGGGSFDFSTSTVVDGGDQDDGSGGSGDGTKVRITKIKRTASFLSFSYSKPHLWANVYESFKQVVPWRRKK